MNGTHEKTPPGGNDPPAKGENRDQLDADHNLSLAQEAIGFKPRSLGDCAKELAGECGDLSDSTGTTLILLGQLGHLQDDPKRASRIIDSVTGSPPHQGSKTNTR